jgi:hypothetical protein
VTDRVLKQQQFARCLARLILEIDRRGYAVTMAEGYVGDSIDKPGEDTPHRRGGTHFKRMGQDLNLWFGDQLLTDTEAHRPFGLWWEAQHPSARWGGHWGDGNHYSFEYEGVK